MKILKCKGKNIEVDEQGYLVDQNQWDEDVARTLASNEGLNSLSAEQVAIIQFMRDYYEEYHFFPILNKVCRITHLHNECVNEQFTNPEIAWKIAGLPKQDGVHFVSMDGKHYSMEPFC